LKEFLISLSTENAIALIISFSHPFEGRMEGKKKRGRPRMMLLDWMMKEDYSKLTERAGQHGEWRHWMYEPA